MGKLRKAWIFFFIFGCSLVTGYQPKGRVPRSIFPGSSETMRQSVKDLSRMRIQHFQSKKCLDWTGNYIVFNTCEDGNNFQLWEMVKDPTQHYAGQLKNVKNGKCLGLKSLGTTDLTLVSCTTTDRKLTTWVCYFPLFSPENSRRNMDWPMAKLSFLQKCMTVENNRVSAQTCKDFTKDNRQRITVFGTFEMGICVKAGSLAPTTQNPDYYIFNSDMFKLTWNTKWVRVHITYAHGMYNSFKNKYGSYENAMKKIEQHARDSLNMVDKLYRQIRFRIILIGIEVRDKSDPFPKPSSSRELHQRVKEHSRSLRLGKGIKFDTSIFYFDGDLFGAAGTASHNFCDMSAYKEVMILTTIRGNAKFIPRYFTNVLTHEFAHLLHAGHNYDPSYTCPSYHLYGGRCTLGGNDWPKAFSGGELRSIRRFKYSCLDSKPSQDAVLGCGNGKIDPGEECDCGRSQQCLTADPCCDGSVCMLKEGMRCSSESFCDHCQITWKTRNSIKVERIIKNEGLISNPAENNLNILKQWYVETNPGTRVELAFHMSFFEFYKNCPYDYIEIRDGSSSNSLLIDKYCRSPPSQTIIASSNKVFITYWADQTFESKFKIFFTGIAKTIARNTDFVIKASNGNCLEFKTSTSLATVSSVCKDKFSFTTNFNIKHKKTGLCLTPRPSYKTYRDNADIELKGDCLSPVSAFVFSGSGRFFHSLSGRCLYLAWNRIRLTSSCDRKEAKFGLIMETPPEESKVIIKHFGGLCFAVTDGFHVILRKDCSQTFTHNKKGELIHDASGKCITTADTSDNSNLIVQPKCTQYSVFKPSGSSLLNVATGKCVHPLNGALYPIENTKTVIFNGCQGNRLQFKMIKV